MHIRSLVALIATLMLGSSACMGQTMTGPLALATTPEVRVDTLIVNPHADTMTIRTSAQLTAHVRTQFGDVMKNANVSWTSRDLSLIKAITTHDTVATIWATAVPGATYVVASSGPASDSARITTVDTACTGLAIDRLDVTPDVVTDTVNQVATLTGTVYKVCGGTVHALVSWVSRNTAIATVVASDSMHARVTPKAAGVTYVVGSIAVSSTVTKKDSSRIEVTADTVTPPPPPDTTTTGTTYFTSDGESGVLVPPWSDWGIVASGDALTPVTSTARVHNGSKSVKYEIAAGTQATNKSQTLAGGPEIPMGSAGKFNTGYYSFWIYIDAGYTANWNMLLGWMTGESGAPDPIMHTGLEIYGGVLQLVIYPKNCTDNLVPSYTCPSIPGYLYDHGEYHMTSGSPAGIVPFPRAQWVHVAAYYKMARTNGQIILWQNGVKIMDVTAPVMNTEDGFWKYNNTANNMIIQFGIYGPGMTGARRIYVDNFKVTNYRTSPTVP